MWLGAVQGQTEQMLDLVSPREDGTQVEWRLLVQCRSSEDLLR